MLLVMDIFVMSQLWCFGLERVVLHLKKRQYMSVGLFLSWAYVRTPLSVVDVKGIYLKHTWTPAKFTHTLLPPLTLLLCPVCLTSPYYTGWRCSESPQPAPINPDFPLDSSILPKQLSFFFIFGMWGCNKTQPAGKSQIWWDRHRFCVCVCFEAR